MKWKCVYMLPLSIALVATVTNDSGKQSDKNYFKIYQRVYVTERSDEHHRHHHHKEKDDSEYWGSVEKGKAMKLLDLNGDMRKDFAYAATSTDTKVSVICSPISAMMPLGILLYGAGHRKTRKELLKATGLDSVKYAHDYFRKLRKKILQLSEVTTHQCSRIYFDTSKHIIKTFKKDAENTFGACIDSVKMSNAKEVETRVNRWIKQNTDGMIPEIIKASDVSPWTIIMIVDALYFSAKWLYKFDRTETETFYGANGDRSISLMHTQQIYMYGSSKVLGAQVILIPYRGGEASMLVLLPHHKKGLDILIKQLKLAPELINTVKMRESIVKLYFPKFRIETSLDLTVLYEKIGMKHIFLEGDGLDEIIKGETIKVHKGIHKAIINVHELGTEAAAATLIQGVGASRPEDKIVTFRADHPFLFFIVAHKQQLFAGTFVG